MPTQSSLFASLPAGQLGGAGLVALAHAALLPSRGHCGSLPEPESPLEGVGGVGVGMVGAGRASGRAHSESPVAGPGPLGRSYLTAIAEMEAPWLHSRAASRCQD